MLRNVATVVFVLSLMLLVAVVDRLVHNWINEGTILLINQILRATRSSSSALGVVESEESGGTSKQRYIHDIPPLETLPNIAVQIFGLVLYLNPPYSNPYGSYTEINSYDLFQYTIVAVAMFDAHSYAVRSSTRLTNYFPDSVTASLLESLSPTELTGYVGYNAARSNMIELGFLVTEMDKIMSNTFGFDNVSLLEAVGPFVLAAKDVVNTKHESNSSGPQAFKSPNQPSPGNYPDCGSLSDIRFYQPYCSPVAHAPPETPCMVESVLYTEFLHSSFVLDQYLNHPIDLTNFPPPNLDFDTFFDRYNKVLQASATLGDTKKSIAEAFDVDSFITVYQISIQELKERNVPLDHSLTIFLSISLAMFDGRSAGRKLKTKFGMARPKTVLACGLQGQPMRSWLGPYAGVGDFINGEDGQIWLPFRTTGASPAYPSCAVACMNTGIRTLVPLLLEYDPQQGGEILGANCIFRAEGSHVAEPRIDDPTQDGFIDGVTNVPNTGYDTIGYSPANDVTFCWQTFEELLQISANSRAYAGLDSEDDIEVAHRLAHILINATSAFLTNLRTHQQ